MLDIRAFGTGRCSDIEDRNGAEVVRACPTCQRRARRVAVRQNPAHPIPTPEQPIYMICCDAVGPYAPTSRGNRYHLVSVDYLTRWPIAQALES